MAWKSPVKCRLMRSIGITCARPPPVAPPLAPNTGPTDGSRSAITVFLPMRLSASPRPIVVVVLPSPAGVGLIAVTRTSLPSGRSASESRKSRSSLAMWLPWKSSASSGMPTCPAISAMGRMRLARAMARSCDMAKGSVNRGGRSVSCRRARRPGAAGAILDVRCPRHGSTVPPHALPVHRAPDPGATTESNSHDCDRPPIPRRHDPPGPGGRDDRDADDGAAQEGPAQCLDPWRAAAGGAAARASRRPRLHAALRAGARGPRDAGVVGFADLDPCGDRGDAGGRDRRRRRDGDHRRRHLRRHPVRTHAQARRRGARHRRRRPRPGRRPRHDAAGVVPRHGGARVGRTA